MAKIVELKHRRGEHRFVDRAGNVIGYVSGEGSAWTWSLDGITGFKEHSFSDAIAMLEWEHSRPVFGCTSWGRFLKPSVPKDQN